MFVGLFHLVRAFHSVLPHVVLHTEGVQVAEPH